VQDLQLDISFFGLVIAAVSVVSSGLQQIFVRTMQQKHKLTAHELLSNTAPAQVGAEWCRLVGASWPAGQGSHQCSGSIALGLGEATPCAAHTPSCVPGCRSSIN